MAKVTRMPSAAATPAPGYYPPQNGHPATIVLHSGVLLTELSKYAERALKDAHANGDPALAVFRRGSSTTLIRVGEDDKLGTVLRTIDKDGLYGVLSRVARWEKLADDEGGKRLLAVDPPSKSKLIPDLLTWPDLGLPRLVGIASHPMLRPNGQWAGLAPGYDAKTQFWFAGSGVIPRMTHREGWTLLRDWLRDFPVDAGARADIVGVLVGNLLRPWLAGHGQWPQPAVVFDASEPGSGKTLLAQGVAAILTGQPNYHIQSCPESDEEWRKNITSWVQLGAAVQIYDNLPQSGVLNSGSLAALLTSGHWRDRILGGNSMVNAPVAAQVMLTGNNIMLSSELSRRVVWVRLVPAVDEPWKRTADQFQHPTSWPVEHRAELLGALVALIQHWVDAGMPLSPTATMGSYELWAQAVGGVLESAGIDGFLTNRDKATERLDEERQVWLGFLDAWTKRFGMQAVGVKDLWALVEDGSVTLPWLTARDEDGKRKQLGRRVRNKVDAVIGAWQVRDAGFDRTNTKLYRLMPVRRDKNPEPQPEVPAADVLEVPLDEEEVR